MTTPTPDFDFQSETPICDKHAYRVGGLDGPRYVQFELAAQIEKELHAALRRATTQAFTDWKPTIRKRTPEEVCEDEVKRNTRYSTIFWFPIADAPLDKRVLLYDSGDMYTGFYSPETKRWMCSHYDSPTPSHWAPLPKGPLP